MFTTKDLVQSAINGNKNDFMVATDQIISEKVQQAVAEKTETMKKYVMVGKK